MSAFTDMRRKESQGKRSSNSSRGQDYLEELYYEGNDFWHVNKDRVLLKLMSGRCGARILDLGCGTGDFDIKLAKQGHEVKVIGVDFYENYLRVGREKARRLRLNVRFVKGDIENYKSKEKFDSVVLSGVIEHIKDDRLLLRRVHGMLKERGRVFILTSAYPWLYSVFDRSIGHQRRYSKKMLTALLADCGFGVEQIKYWDSLGLPVLVFSRIFNKGPSVRVIGNRHLNFLLDWWFRMVENRMVFPFGLDLIVVAKK